MPTRHFLRSTGTDPTFDLSTTQGTDATVVASNPGNDTVFAERVRWQITVGDTVTGTSFPCSVVVTAVAGTAEYRYRIQRANSGGTVQASSAYSATYSAAGTQTDTLSLTTTWAAGDILRLSFEGRLAGGMGGSSATVGTDRAASYVDATLAVPTTATINYWNGSAWGTGSLRRWDGTIWADTVLKRYNGTDWEIV